MTYVTVCILVIPLLYIIEAAANHYNTPPILWVTDLGLPVSFFWLATLGILGLFRKLTHANAWIIAGLSAIAIYYGEQFTNLKVDQLTGGAGESWRLSDHYPVIYFGTAAILLFIGLMVAVAKYIKKTQ